MCFFAVDKRGMFLVHIIYTDHEGKSVETIRDPINAWLKRKDTLFRMMEQNTEFGYKSKDGAWKMDRARHLEQIILKGPNGDLVLYSEDYDKVVGNIVLTENKWNVVPPADLYTKPLFDILRKANKNVRYQYYLQNVVSEDLKCTLEIQMSPLPGKHLFHIVIWVF